MKRFVEGLDRGQSTLFPASLDDYMTEDNPVRAVFLSTVSISISSGLSVSSQSHRPEDSVREESLVADVLPKLTARGLAPYRILVRRRRIASMREANHRIVDARRSD
jgi:hypothetical protein